MLLPIDLVDFGDHAQRVTNRTRAQALALRGKAGPRPKHNDCANDREKYSCGVKWGAFGWLAEDTRDEAAHKRTHDAENARHQDPHVLRSRQNEACNRAHYDTDNKHPNKMKHEGLLRLPLTL